MRTRVNLDQDVYDAAMHLSRSTGRRLGEVISELARKGLRDPAKVHKQGKSRFPVFEVPEDAPVIPAARIQKAIEEDLE